MVWWPGHSTPPATPVAKGSNVPACPTLIFLAPVNPRRAYRTLFTTSNEVHVRGLSMTMTWPSKNASGRSNGKSCEGVAGMGVRRYGRWDLGYFDGMKFPVLCFFGVLVAAPALAQMAPFSVHTSATMLEHRSSFQMVQLEEDAAGGPALMALGGNDGTAVTATTEMGLENWDDVGPDVWEEAAPMLEARMDFTAHAMLGDVWVFGGFDGTYTLDASERFDVVSDTWSQGPAMSVPRTNHRSVRMNDGRILITGGFDGQGETSSCEVFDPVDMTFTSVAPMNVGRASHTLTPVGDGRFVVTGGFNAARVSVGVL